MKIRALLPGLVLVLCPTPGIPQTQRAGQKDSAVLVKAGKLLDVRTGTYLAGGAVWVEGGRVKEVGPAAKMQGDAPGNIRVIDLGGATMLPGLIDCHTHLMARFDVSEHGYILGLATKSQAFRALEGAANARATLLAGIHDGEGHGERRVRLR